MKPCPFCGSDAGVFGSHLDFQVRCNSCSARVGGISDDVAIYTWNRRPSPWIESAKQEPPKNWTWIFGRWSFDGPADIHAIHMVHWSENDCRSGWQKLDGWVANDPKWWMPIPPLEGS